MANTQIDPLLTLSKIPPDYLNIMGYVDQSEVNGPGYRAVVWVQGCLRECPGCFNPESWPFEANQLISIADLARKILANPLNTGVTFSGGEPFWQARNLAALARKLKAAGLNVMSFTGFRLEELQSDTSPPASQDLLEQLDFLIDGPFVASQALRDPTSLVASRNQRVLVLNPSLNLPLNWASDQIEVHIFADGSRIVTGYLGKIKDLTG